MLVIVTEIIANRKYFIALIVEHQSLTLIKRNHKKQQNKNRDSKKKKKKLRCCCLPKEPQSWAVLIMKGETGKEWVEVRLAQK